MFIVIVCIPGTNFTKLQNTKLGPDLTITIKIKPNKIKKKNHIFSQQIWCIWQQWCWMTGANLLVPGRFGCNLELVIFKLTSRVDMLSISCEIALSWMPQDFTDDKSTLAQVMAWCLTAPSHYLGQCWPRSTSTHDIGHNELITPLITCSLTRPLHGPCCVFILTTGHPNVWKWMGSLPWVDQGWVMTWTCGAIQSCVEWHRAILCPPGLCWYPRYRPRGRPVCFPWPRARNISSLQCS